MPRVSAALFLVWATLSAPVVAQSPTDFSGRWTVASPATGARGGGPQRGDMGSGWTPTIVITQNANELVVEQVLFTRNDLQSQPRFAYALDGSETRHTLMLGRGPQTQTARVRWDGPRLVITTSHAYTDPVSGKLSQVDVTQTLTLETPDRLLVDAARTGASATRTVYTKN